MEVVFSNTAEIGALQGIDDSTYYYANGVGGLKGQSALNCNYPIVQSFNCSNLFNLAFLSFTLLMCELLKLFS